MKKVLAIVAVLALTAAAQAGVTVTQVYTGDVTTAGGPAKAFDVYLSADSAIDTMWVYAIDLEITGLYQVWYKGKIDTPTPTEADAVNLLWFPERDSHFCASFSATVVAPYETNNAAYAPGGATSDIEGVGVLGAIMGIGEASWAQDLKLARVVVLDTDQYAYLSGAAGNGIGEVWYFTLVPIGVPEPTTLSLLALGGLAVIRRRRS
jgi:hypothetical protein